MNEEEFPCGSNVMVAFTRLKMDSLKTGGGGDQFKAVFSADITLGNLLVAVDHVGGHNGEGSLGRALRK